MDKLKWIIVAGILGYIVVAANMVMVGFAEGLR